MQISLHGQLKMIVAADSNIQLDSVQLQESKDKSSILNIYIIHDPFSWFLFLG